jgi:hypothetical protein
MKTEDFEKVVEETLQQIREVLIIKSREYSRNGDKMHNFNVGAMMTGEIREKVLAGFALKHHISIMDIRNDIAKGILPSIETVNEKYGDAINYLILEKASITDRINKQTQPEINLTKSSS